MRDLVVGVVVGLIVGALLGYAFTLTQSPQVPSESCGANIPSNFSENLDKAVERLNSIIHANYPDVNIRVTKSQSYGKFYLLDLEFYNKNGTLARESAFLSENGSILLFNNPRCVVSLTEPKPEKVNVSTDDDPYFGPDNAKVVIVEFSDYTCPYCAKFANEVEPKIRQNYGDKVKFVFRDFPVHGDMAYKAAEAADCAGEQGKYWEYHQLLYQNQRKWISNTTLLYTYAEQLGLNVTAFKACLNSDRYREEVRKDQQDGVKYGVTGTPTFFINGKKYVGYMPYEQFAKLIDEELSK